MPDPRPKSQVSIVAIILSGGAGRRFGGLDKGLQNYKTKPLIEHVIDALKGQVNTFILCVNRNQDRYSKYGYPLVEDAEQRNTMTGRTFIDETYVQGTIVAGPIFEGPMAGVNAAAAFIQRSGLGKNTSHVLLSSCDSPALPKNYVNTLLIELNRSGKSVAVAHDGERRQNLHCLIKADALPSLQQFFQTGGRAMHRWYQEVGMVEVDFSDQAEAFLNINSREQLNQRLRK